MDNDKFWDRYQEICKQKGLTPTPKDSFLKESRFGVDVLLEKIEKTVINLPTQKLPLLEYEENVTMARRVLHSMIEMAYKKGLEDGKKG